MGLWPTIINLLNDKEVTVRTGIAWICGTAVQNNPDAQKAFLEHRGLETLIPLLLSEHKQERAKVVYAISGILKHQPLAVEEFKSLKGFDHMTSILKNHLEDDAATVRKIIFLYNTLLLENPSLATTELQSLVDDLDKVIITYTIKIEDEDMVEKALRTLHTFIQQTQNKLSEDKKQHVIDAKNKYGQDNLNLDKNEWDQF
ncbi:armadillo-type protein [Cunninghamella echinulata]|nr:armadillo-type protein [Cunninghamella echinulata]